jgi:hypothetical protein
MRSRRLVLFTISTAALAFAALGVPPPAQASTARVRSVKISGPSPLPDQCGTPFPGPARGTEYEPHIAVNPAHPRNLIAVYSQDNQINTVASASRDGGRHWTPVPIPGLSDCTNGTAGNAIDPRVTIGPDGIAYTSSSDQSTTTQSVLVNTSTDGGRSWSNPVTVDTYSSIDGPDIIADPNRAGTAYATWTRIPSIGQPSLLFSRTTDGGVTWTSPTFIPITPDPGDSEAGSEIHVLPDGTLVGISIQDRIDLTRCGEGCVDGPTDVRLVRSTDQGDNWSGPIHVASVAANVLKNPDNPGVCSTTTSQPCGTNSDCAPPRCPTCAAAGETCGVIGTGISFPIPRAAVGADGTVFVVWHLITSTTSSQIQFVKSVDGGQTWSTPAPVADEPTQAFLPTVAVSPAGTVGVTYFDFRNDVLGDQELTTDLWFRHSHDGGATWSETHVAGPFDLRPAPSPGVYPLGDYFGLAPIRKNGFGALWIQTIPPQGEGNTDAFFARIKVSPRQ